MSGEPIVVSGLGMRTAVGHHAVQSCASIRAGLNRFTAWPHFGLDGGLIASSVRPALRDGSWVDKLVDLAEPALAEALWSARLFEWPLALPHARTPARVCVFLTTGYLDRPGVDTEQLQELHETVAEDLFPDEAGVRLELLPLDHAAGLVGVARACEELQRGRADLCVVGGGDSLLDSVYLQALLEAGRLKVPHKSSGLIPGEAAGFLVLEQASLAERRGAPAHLQIDAVALERDEPWEPQAPVRGRAMARALRTVLDAARGGEDFGHVLCDLNGERWRFLEWAVLETRCLGGIPHGWRLWHPADCIGDVGGAFGSVAVGLAAHILRRVPGDRSRILITSTSERGERAALSVSRAKEHICLRP